MTEKEAAYGDDGEETPSLMPCATDFTIASPLLTRHLSCRSFKQSLHHGFTRHAPCRSPYNRFTTASLLLHGGNIAASRDATRRSSELSCYNKESFAPQGRGLYGGNANIYCHDRSAFVI